MAQTASTGSFLVGRDVTAIAIAGNGQRLDLNGVTDFDIKPVISKARSTPLNGPPIERHLPGGHNFKFMVDRVNAANDQLFSGIEAGWWNFGSADPGTSNNGSVFVTITETSGAQTTYQLSGVTMSMTNLGDYKTDTPIKQTIEGFASRMQVV